ncbi:MAG: hypothetical protein ABIS51_04775 [Sphingomonas sp.]
MRDDYLSAEWSSNHHQVSAAIHKAISVVAKSFERLNAYQFDAPWRDQSHRSTSAGR